MNTSNLTNFAVFFCVCVFLLRPLPRRIRICWNDNSIGSWWEECDSGTGRCRLTQNSSDQLGLIQHVMVGGFL